MILTPTNIPKRSIVTRNEVNGGLLFLFPFHLLLIIQLLASLTFHKIFRLLSLKLILQLSMFSLIDLSI
jgi:hypothetical protein